MTCKGTVWGALFAGLTGLLAGTGSTASAQEAPAEQQLTLSTADNARADEADERKKKPMGWAGLGLKLGAGGVGATELEYEATTVAGAAGIQPMGSRAGFQLSVPINLGGDGFGWMIEPYMNFASIRATGLYTGPTINIHIMDPLYLAVGFGVKFAYLGGGTGLDMGVDVGGRVPITGTYYIHPDLGLIAELGLGYTASGYAFTTPGQTDITFGSAFAWDFSVGARWP